MPRFAQMSPRDDPERAQLIQTYMVLHAKQTSVRRRLSATSISPPCSPISTSPAPSSPVLGSSPSTPVRRRQHSGSPRSSSHQSRSPFPRRISFPSVPSIPELPEQEADVDSDEEKLAEIGLHIRSTLTDLLNCASVRDDNRMRAWVQTRLCDAQRSPSPDDRCATRGRILDNDGSIVTPASLAAAERWRARRSTGSASSTLPLSAMAPVPAYEDGVRDISGLLDDGIRKMSL